MARAFRIVVLFLAVVHAHEVHFEELEWAGRRMRAHVSHAKVVR